MKLKFFNDYEGQIDPDEISLYLQCPKCKNTWQYHDYFSNPVASTVSCDYCGYENMGVCFKKAIKKKKALTKEDKREIIRKYSLIPEDFTSKGRLRFGVVIPYNAPPDHPGLVKWKAIDELITMLENERPFCRMLKIIYEKEKELLPYTRDQLIDVISSWGYPQNLIKKATYFGLIQSTRRKRKDDNNNMTTVNSATTSAYYTLTDQGKKILRFAETWRFTAEDIKDPMPQKQNSREEEESAFIELNKSLDELSL